MTFPNFRNKHAHDSIFTPEEFLKYQRKLGKYPKFKPPKGVIFCYSSRLLEHILKNHKAVKVRGFYGEFYLLDETKDQIGVLAKFGVGAPVVVTLMEELIAFGVKKFISIGEAGTLQKTLKIRDIVVCNRAIRDEGTSHHYLKHSKYAYASEEMTRELEKALREYGQKYLVGTSWTIDAPYRETVAEAEQYRKENVATVDMEAAALFAVAKYRNVDIGAIFTISDSIAELKWKPKFHLSERNWEILFQIAKEALLNS